MLGEGATKGRERKCKRGHSKWHYEGKKEREGKMGRKKESNKTQRLQLKLYSSKRRHFRVEKENKGEQTSRGRTKWKMIWLVTLQGKERRKESSNRNLTGYSLLNLNIQDQAAISPSAGNGNTWKEGQKEDAKKERDTEGQRWTLTRLGETWNFNIHT